MIDGLAFVAVEASRTLSRSALPDAPVVPDLPRRRPVVRASAARALRWAAEYLEPAPRPAHGIH